MTNQDYSQKDSMDAEIHLEKNLPSHENEDTNLPNRDHADSGATPEFIIPKKGPDEIPAPDLKHDPGVSGRISESEGKILEQIQKLQNDLAESVRNEGQLIQLVNEQNTMFKTKISYDDQKEKIIDKMHEDLQTLRSGLYQNLIRPVLIDVIRIRDNMRRMEADINKKNPDGMVPIKIISDYYLDLGDLLEGHNVEILEEKPETTFIPAKQKVVNRVVTDNRDLHGKIARSISSGYIYNGQVISQQRVDVYVFDDSNEQCAGIRNATTQLDHGGRT
jgi:molecular chaperone GrpE (heat shock protein)